MARERRRFQNPKPYRRGARWCLRVWRDEFVNGQLVRRRVEVDLGSSSDPVRKAAKQAQRVLAPLNEGRKNSANGSVSFSDFVYGTYLKAELPLLARSTQERYRGVLDKYLLPSFEKKALGEMDVRLIQMYFTGMASSPLAQESREKIWTVLSSVMQASIKYGCLDRNPCHGVKLPAAKKGKTVKHHITSAQFADLVELIAEPYATMVYVATLTGLRVSELAGLKWGDIGENSITIDERYCRGDWGAPKSDASNATIPVLPQVIQRIHRLKTLKVRVGGGRGGYQTYSAVKSEAPDALVFQGIRKGVPIRDNNILSRHLKPAGKKLGIPWVNWRCLRTSFATLLKEQGVHVRDAQALMRHSKASTTLDIYQQTTDAHQRLAIGKLEGLAGSRMVN